MRDTLSQLIEQMERDKTKYRSYIDRWIEYLRGETPYWAMGTSERYFHAAAYIEAIVELRGRIERWGTLEEVIACYMDDVMKEAQFIPMSTSVTDILARRYLLAAKAEILEKLKAVAP